MNIRGMNVLIVLIVGVVGVWGCAKGPGDGASASAERLKAMETKCAKLENDYRAVATARDQVRKRAFSLEEERDLLQKQIQVLQTAARERDQLRNQVHSRTSERDALQLRCDRLKKGLQNLIGQDDAMLTPAAGPSLEPVSGGRS